MWSDEEHIRSFRMHAHHLDRMLPAGSLKEAAFIGFQDPGRAAQPPDAYFAFLHLNILNLQIQEGSPFRKAFPHPASEPA